MFPWAQSGWAEVAPCQHPKGCRGQPQPNPVSPLALGGVLGSWSRDSAWPKFWLTCEVGGLGNKMQLSAGE